MPVEVQAEVTTLLDQIRGGDEQARDRLGELVYEELRRMAGGLMHRERPDHTLGATDLVHEVYLRLFRQPFLEAASNRAYLFGAAAQAMRRILVEHARRKAAIIRGGGYVRVPFDDVYDQFEKSNADVLALHEALEALSALSARQGRVVELRYFGGYEIAEIAEALDVSESTVEKDLTKARAFLHGRLAGG